MHKSWMLTAVLVLGIAGGAYASYLYLRPAPLPEQLLYGNGHIEGTEIHVPAETAGRIVENRLVEGKHVDAGELLIRLDDTDLRLQQQRASAEIEVLQAERERSASEIGIWQHHLAVAERDLNRYRKLRERKAASAQQVEQVENVFQEAKGHVAALNAELTAADKRIAAAHKEKDLIDNRLTKTRVVAPIGGTVLVKVHEKGEFVQPGQPIAILVDLSRVELKVFIPEADVGKTRLDAPARIRVDAFPERLFDARVARIGQQAQFTPRDVHMPEERVRMVFGLTLAVANPDGVLKPGMPADAWILWQQDGEWPQHLFVPRS